jgi:hypothetical protein
MAGRMIRAIAVFLAVAVSDAMWTHYIIHASTGQSFAAASYAAGIVIASAFVTLAFVRDRIYIIPAVLGAFVGTFLSV